MGREPSQSLTGERVVQWWRWRWGMGGHDYEGAGCLGPELGSWSMGWDVAFLEVEPEWGQSCGRGWAFSGGGLTHCPSPPAGCSAASAGWVLSRAVLCRRGNSPCPWWSGRTVPATWTPLGSRDPAASHEVCGGRLAWSPVAAVGPHDTRKLPCPGCPQARSEGRVE